mgnify:CR=1 FL=1
MQVNLKLIIHKTYSIINIDNNPMKKVVFILVFSIFFSLCSSEIEEGTVSIETSTTTATTVSSTVALSKNELSDCEENILVMKSLFTLIGDIVLSSLNVEDYDEKIKLFDTNKEYLIEIGIYIANVPVSTSEQLVIRNLLEDYRMLALADAAISYKILNEDIGRPSPLWDQYEIQLNDLFELEENLAEYLENFQCDI